MSTVTAYPLKRDAGLHEGGSPPEALRRLRRRATRILVATSILFAPVPFSELFVVGLVPLWCTAVYFLRGIPGTGGEVLLPVAILAVHLIVDGGLLYLTATVISRLLFGLCPTRIAIFAVGFLLAGQAIASFFPVYVLAGEHDTELLSLWRVSQRFVMGGP